MRTQQALSGEINDTSVETLFATERRCPCDRTDIHFFPTIILAPLFSMERDTERLNTIFVWCIQKAGPTL